MKNYKVSENITIIFTALVWQFVTEYRIYLINYLLKIHDNKHLLKGHHYSSNSTFPVGTAELNLVFGVEGKRDEVT